MFFFFSYDLLCHTIDDISSEFVAVKNNLRIHPTSFEDMYPMVDKCKLLIAKESIATIIDYIHWVFFFKFNKIMTNGERNLKCLNNKKVCFIELILINYF